MTNVDQPDNRPITEDWLKEVGFRWHQVENQSEKQWLLWVGGVIYAGFMGTEDLGIEVSVKKDGTLCWLRGDYSHRYSRFIFVRAFKFQDDLIRFIESVTAQAWEPANHLYGSMHKPEAAEHYREQDARRAQRLDQQFLRPNWREIEKEESRGRPLVEHVEAAENIRKKAQ